MPRGRTKSSQLVVGALAPMATGVSTMSVSHQTDQDRRAIIRTLEEYTRAWFGGDAAAMERCLHPDLTARLLQLEPEGKNAGGIRMLARSQGIQATLGACTHPMERRSEITVLDISGHSASARALLGDWAAYVHLSFTGQRWAIVNVLWEWLSSKDRRSA
jgi:hypothetical protein